MGRLDDIVARDAHMQNDRGTHETVAESLEKVAEAVAKGPPQPERVAVGKIVVIALLVIGVIWLVVLSLLR